MEAYQVCSICIARSLSVTGINASRQCLRAATKQKRPASTDTAAAVIPSASLSIKLFRRRKENSNGKEVVSKVVPASPRPARVMPVASAMPVS